MTNPTTPAPNARRLDWGVPVALIVLSLIPALGGAIRLVSYAPGATALPDEGRFAGFHGLLVAHIVGALGFALGGAFQFSRVLQGRAVIHRRLGRFAAVCGLVGGLAGMWGVFAFAPQPEGSPALSAIRLLAGGAMVTCLVLGWRAALSRSFVAHGRWMSRAYALGSAGGTQALVLAPLTVIQGPSAVVFAVVLALGFLVNLAVVEWLLRRDRRGARRSHGVVAAA